MNNTYSNQSGAGKSGEHQQWPDLERDYDAAGGIEDPAKQEAAYAKALDALAAYAAEEAGREKEQTQAAQALHEAKEAFEKWREQKNNPENREAFMRAWRRANPKSPPVSKASEKVEKLPEPILSAKGQGGAILSEGSVAILAGEGGIAKSSLVNSMALALASGPPETTSGHNDNPLEGGLFETRESKPVPVLLLTYEDPANVLRWKLQGLADTRNGKDKRKPLDHISIMDMQGFPIFGPRPADRGIGAALYNARPEPLPGWDEMLKIVTHTNPRLVVIDPAMAAFVGNGNDAGPVREFLGALTGLARDHKLGVLLVAHSTKAARGGKGSDPDPFEPGQVGGSSHWTDGVRGVLTMCWKPESLGGKPGDRILAISKANWGPARIWADLSPVRKDDKGAFLGINGLKGEDEKVWRTKQQQENNDGKLVEAAKAANPGKDITGGKRTSKAAPPKV